MRLTVGALPCWGWTHRLRVRRSATVSGVLAEGIDLYGRLTGKRHLELALKWTDGEQTPETLLDRVGLAVTDAERKVGGYSKGMKQRLALAMALAGDRISSSSTTSTGLDPNGIRTMRELVRSEAAAGTTVFFSSHDLGRVEAVCDRVAILNDGNLITVDTIDGLREAIGARAELYLRIPEARRGSPTHRWSLGC